MRTTVYSLSINDEPVISVETDCHPAFAPQLPKWFIRQLIETYLPPAIDRIISRRNVFKGSEDKRLCSVSN